MQTKRGGFLTTMAILLAPAAIEDMLKPSGNKGQSRQRPSFHESDPARIFRP
jgi:hypothetical protein